MTDSAMENAKLMIETFTKGLADGVKHFDKNGKELKTVKEILETLQVEGNVAVEFPKGQAPGGFGKRIICQAWESYLSEVIPPTAHTTQKVETRRAFYAGAHAVFTGMLANLSSDGELTRGDLEVMGGIQSELDEFLAELGRLAKQQGES